MWSRSELKARAKEVLKLNYWKAVLVSLIFSFVAGGGSGSGGGTSSSSGSSYSGSYSGGGSSGTFSSPEAITAFFAAISIVLFIILIVFAVALVLSIFVFNPLAVGCQRFFLLCESGSGSLNDIPYVFSHSYMNVVKIMFFKSLYTFLWSLLLIIPGIIKGLEYRMIPYILAENPDISKEEAFALSRNMMEGEKWNAFVLDLSFLGWLILGLFTCCILNVFYVNPYQNLTNAELYHVLKQKISGSPYGGSSYHDGYQQNNSDATINAGPDHYNPYI